jgi:hypothetical protein
MRKLGKIEGHLWIKKMNGVQEKSSKETNIILLIGQLVNENKEDIRDNEIN